MKIKTIKNSYIIDVLLFLLSSVMILFSNTNNLGKYIKIIVILIGIEGIISIIRGLKYKKFYIFEGIINIFFAILLYSDKYSSIDNLMFIFVVWGFIINTYLLINYLKNKSGDIKYYDMLMAVIVMFIIFNFIYIFGYKPNSLAVCFIVLAITQWYVGKK